MNDLTALGDALLWPLAAGVAVVAWVRASSRARRAAAAQTRLRELYQEVAARPVPDRLAMVVDALEEGEELAGGAPAGAKVPADR